MPTKMARLTIAWPMCSSDRPGSDGDRRDVDVIQRMAGVECEPGVDDLFARVGDFLQFVLELGVA